MAKTKKGQNKLSRSYRFKKKVGIVKKQTENNNTQNQQKKARIVIRNLSFQTSEADIQKLYRPFGEIEDINLLKRPDGKLVGCGFVQFKNIEDASKAIFKTNKTNFLGRTISSAWAIPKTEFYENLKKEKELEEIKNEDENIETSVQEQTITLDSETPKKKKNSHLKRNTLTKAEQRKIQKEKKRKKRSRIVIRNLPFTVTEELIKENFKKYGNIEDINLLRKPNGAPTGCCFLQFDRVQSATQAIHYENMKSFQERPMVVDWAIPKDKYVKTNEGAGVKTEIKCENGENLNDSEIKIKEEIDSEDEVKKETDNEDEIKEESDNSEEENTDDSDSDNDENDDDDKKNIKIETDNESVTQHPRRISNDVSEGKTVFIKNVPFTAKNEDLKQCMEQFGPVYYALICMDRLTEHSKGTAFVKFRNVEDAEKCLAAGTELKLHDQILDPHKALHRTEVNEKNLEKKKKDKDSRNLYLVKEGVILASSPAAKDVSAPDMAKRLQLEKWKSQMLRNLSMFVSKVRLVVHNLPPSLDDTKLRQLFKNHSNPKAVINEARVMRDLRNLDANGIGKSKEYGFVSFTNHEDALKALRSINNNPNIFTKTKRPIVAFSIENRVMINAKQKRLEKSRQHNPLNSNQKRPLSDDTKEDQSTNNETQSNEKPQNKRKKFAKKPESKKNTGEKVESFTGTTSKPGFNRMNGKFFLKKQAAQHQNNLKLQKKKARNMKQIATQKKEQFAKRKEAKPKQGSKKPDADEVNFSRLVENHRNKQVSARSAKSKWYET